MKTATLPSLRVDERLRKDAESVLEEGETLSAFVEASVRAQIAERQHREAFLERGRASLAGAEKSGAYHESGEVLSGLRQKLKQVRAKSAR